MKRILQIALALAAVFTLSVQALAVNADDFWYQDDSGAMVYDQAGYDLVCAQEKVQTAGISLSPLDYLHTDADGREYFDTAAFEADYAAAVAAKTPPQIKPDESAGVKDDGHVSGDTQESDDKFLVGSYIDTDGRIWAPDGRLLSNGSASPYAPVEDAALPGDVLDTPDASISDPVDDVALLEVIAGLVSDIASDPATSTVIDMRSLTPPVEVLDGLKALVVSIFGSYTPITTTAVVPETAGNDTSYYLVTVVADGAAGVDYEWCAGVFLFGILLFCLMKLLGGVLK